MKIISENISKNIQIENDEVAFVLNDGTVVVSKIIAADQLKESIEKLFASSTIQSVKKTKISEAPAAAKPVCDPNSWIGECKFDIKRFEEYRFDKDDDKEFLNYFYSRLFISEYLCTGKTGKNNFGSINCYQAYHDPKFGIKEVILDSEGRMWKDAESAAKYYGISENVVNNVINNDERYPYAICKKQDGTWLYITFCIGSVFAYSVATFAPKNIYTDLLKLQLKLKSITSEEFYKRCNISLPNQNTYSYLQYLVDRGIVPM